VDLVAITWPGGATTKLRDLAADRVYTLAPER